MAKVIGVPLCVDGRMLHKPGTGVSTYARGLRRAQSEISDMAGVLTASDAIFPPLFHALGGHARPAKEHSHIAEGHFELVSPDVFRRAHLHFKLTGRLLRVVPEIPFGIMHWTYPVPIYFEKWINVHTIHDIIPIINPELSGVSGERLLKIFKQISKFSQCITTISESSLEDIDSIKVFDKGKLVVSGLPVEVDCLEGALVSEKIQAMGLKKKQYLLFVGAVEERKNLQRLLAAYRQSGISMPLVIVGPATSGGAEIEAALRATPGVIRLPYQDRQGIDALVAGAYALTFPSLAEGFGLPIIEAMASGTAVLTSRIPAISEVAGDAALLVDPLSVADIAGGLQQLAGNPHIIASLEAAGLKRSKLYSMDRFSAKLTDIYSNLLNHHQ